MIPLVCQPPSHIAELASHASSDELRRAYADIDAYSQIGMPGYRLRAYQLEPARAIAKSVLGHDGGQFAVVFSRQAGKDELLAQLLAYLLTRHALRGGTAVIAAPTFQPQAALSRDRLLARLDPGRNRLTRTFVDSAVACGLHDGYAVTLGRAAVRFLSAAPGSGARGQTADLLLVANEAQDIQPEIWDAVFDPMASNTNATTVFLGTIWDRGTLLARQIRHLEEAEQTDGVRRVWRVDWETVAQELPAYGERVRARIAQFGPDHPFIRTEYRLLELDGEGGLFPPSRLAHLRGDHPRRHSAEPGKRYALLLDVAGEEETTATAATFQATSRRDATALTVVEIDGDGQRARRPDGKDNDLFWPAGRLADLPSRPVYRVVDRQTWTGIKHVALHDQIVDLARNVWKASAVVVDATGIGAGLAAFLAAELGTRRGSSPGIKVVPFIFSAASKSTLGWDFLSLIDAGRLKDYADDGTEVTRTYWRQLANTVYDTPPGPGKPLRWSVPASRGHDDLVMSAALTAVLDRIDWRPRLARGTSGPYDLFDEEIA